MRTDGTGPRELRTSRKGRSRELLLEAGIGITSHRLAIVDAFLGSGQPLRPRDVLNRLQGRIAINKVTVYRNLDLLVDKGLLHRISSGERSFRYGLSAAIIGRPHAHFHCTSCDRVVCLSPDEIRLEALHTQNAPIGTIESVEIRFDGTCATCLDSGSEV